MRVPIAHTLPKEEVRRRLRERSHEIANFIPGGMADVTTGWPNEDRMDLSVRAMGQGIDGRYPRQGTETADTVTASQAFPAKFPFSRN